jgi:hypothetical protein
LIFSTTFSGFSETSSARITAFTDALKLVARLAVQKSASFPPRVRNADFWA